MSARVTLEIEDSGPEFERIKQHYAPSNSHPGIAPDVLEIQNDLQRLQSDLQQFLLHYISDITTLHMRVSSRPTNGGPGTLADDGPATEVPTATKNPWPSDSESQKPDNSSESISEEPLPPTPPAPIKPVHIPMDTHIQDMQIFLKTHLESLQLLQKSMSAPPPKDVSAQTNESATKEQDRLQYETMNQQFNMLVVISTFTASLIVGFLSLVVSIINSRHRVAFSIGMFFAFISLGIHFGNIVVAGRGIALTSQADTAHDINYFKLYLSVCEQLQFAATLVFIMSTIIMTFLIFSSVAFPIVLIILSIIGLLIVFTSVYWEVSITLKNLKFLIKHIRVLKQAFNSISNKHNRKIFPRPFRQNKAALMP